LNVLAHLKISPSYIIGESFGELAAAYAEGVLSAEEAVLSAYAIGNALAEAKIIPSQNSKYIYKSLIAFKHLHLLIMFSFTSRTCIVFSRRIKSIQTYSVCFTVREFIIINLIIFMSNIIKYITHF
jgi:hypothetical protein